ncbi:eight-cysteine-cluster domain-containing protein [Patescibacteria group bacterium]
MRHYSSLKIIFIIIAGCILGGVMYYVAMQDTSDQVVNNSNVSKDVAIVESEPSEDNTPTEPLTSYCENDDDCIAWGCSGHLCGALSEVTNLVTTCEYRAEYACTQFSQCGCFAGTCMWDQTTEYTECVTQFQ